MPGSRPLSADEHRFNAYMAKQRMAVEWGFGKIMQLFQFCNLKWLDSTCYSATQKITSGLRQMPRALPDLVFRGRRSASAIKSQWKNLKEQ